MTLVAPNQDSGNDMMSLIKQRRLLRGSLLDLQIKLRSACRNSLSQEERDNLTSQERELQSQIAVIDSSIQNTKLATLLQGEMVEKSKTPRPPLKDFPIFVRGEDDIIYFLDKFVDFMQHYGVPKERWGENIVHCFENEAYYYVRKRVPVDELSWPKFAEDLKRQFGTSYSDLEKVNDILYFRQEKGETIDLCCDRFAVLADRCCSDRNAFLVAIFLKGINRGMRNYILRSYLFETCYPELPKIDDVLKTAMKYKFIINCSRNQSEE
jgi:hypothetical protein